MVGFFVAKYVVNFINTPVLEALKRYMVAAAKEELRLKYAGEVPEDALKILDEQVLIVEEVYFERGELSRIQGTSAGETSTGKPAESNALAAFDTKLPPPKLDFVKTRIWRQAQAKLQALDPWETFMIYLKAALVVGRSTRLTLYLLPAVDLRSGRAVRPRTKIRVPLPAAELVSVSGGCFRWRFAFVFAPVLDFLFGYNREMNIAPEMRISSIISFVLLLPLGFGVSFQLPLVMFFLNRMGLVEYETFVKQWRIAILIIFVVSMVLTPSPGSHEYALDGTPLDGVVLHGPGDDEVDAGESKSVRHSKNDVYNWLVPFAVHKFRAVSISRRALPRFERVPGMNRGERPCG